MDWNYGLWFKSIYINFPPNEKLKKKPWQIEVRITSEFTNNNQPTVVNCVVSSTTHRLNFHAEARFPLTWSHVLGGGEEALLIMANPPSIHSQTACNRSSLLVHINFCLHLAFFYIDLSCAGATLFMFDRSQPCTTASVHCFCRSLRQNRTFADSTPQESSFHARRTCFLRSKSAT